MPEAAVNKYGYARAGESNVYGHAPVFRQRTICDPVAQAMCKQQMANRHFWAGVAAPIGLHIVTHSFRRSP